MQCNLDNLTVIFESMNKDGWDCQQEMRWGFFFYNKNKANLYILAEELEQKKFITDNVIKITPTSWRLSVYKIDRHTPESLHKLNQDMNKLAISFNVDVYDGWDAERINR